MFCVLHAVVERLLWAVFGLETNKSGRAGWIDASCSIQGQWYRKWEGKCHCHLDTIKNCRLFTEGYIIMQYAAADRSYLLSWCWGFHTPFPTRVVFFLEKLRKCLLFLSICPYFTLFTAVFPWLLSDTDFQGNVTCSVWAGSRNISQALRLWKWIWAGMGSLWGCLETEKFRSGDAKQGSPMNTDFNVVVGAGTSTFTQSPRPRDMFTVHSFLADVRYDTTTWLGENVENGFRGFLIL